MSRTFTWMMALAAAATLAAVSLRAQSQAPPAGQTVEVTAERFVFQPSEIKVAVGTTLTVVLKSDDTTHGFRIKGEGVNVQIPKRGRGSQSVSGTTHPAYRCRPAPSTETPRCRFARRHPSPARARTASRSSGT